MNAAHWMHPVVHWIPWIQIECSSLNSINTKFIEIQWTTFIFNSMDYIHWFFSFTKISMNVVHGNRRLNECTVSTAAYFSICWEMVSCNQTSLLEMVFNKDFMFIWHVCIKSKHDETFRFRSGTQLDKRDFARAWCLTTTATCTQSSMSMTSPRGYRSRTWPVGLKNAVGTSSVRKYHAFLLVCYPFKCRN